MKSKMLGLLSITVFLPFFVCCEQLGPQWDLYSDNDCPTCTQQTWVDDRKVRDIYSGSGEQYLGRFRGTRYIRIMKECNGTVTLVCDQVFKLPEECYVQVCYVEADLLRSCEECEISWSLDPPT